MAVFIYKRQLRHDDLDIEVGINLNRFPELNHTAHAWIKAKGRVGARARWREDFWRWARDRELDAYSPVYGNRRYEGTSAFDCYLKTWRAVADLLVQWVGLEALSNALADGDADQRMADELASLNQTIVGLTRELAELRAASSMQQLALRNVGLAILAGSSTNLIAPT